MHAHRQAAVAALGGADQLQPETELARVLAGRRRAGARCPRSAHRRGAPASRTPGARGSPSSPPRRGRRRRRWGRPRRSRRAGPRPAPARRSSRRVISVRMKLVVPLTIPWMRSIGVADERFLEHAHDRHGARHGRLEAQPHVVLARASRTAPRRAGRAAACSRVTTCLPGAHRRAAGSRARVRCRPSPRPSGRSRRGSPRSRRASASARR